MDSRGELVCFAGVRGVWSEDSCDQESMPVGAFLPGPKSEASGAPGR
jgi:hypothetical protein